MSEKINKLFEKIDGEFKDERMVKIIEEHHKRYAEEQAYLEKFKKEKKYVDILDNIESKSNDSLDWDSSDYGMVFGMLHGTAQEMLNFEEEIVIKYKDKYIELFEMHGQGCFQNIRVTTEISEGSIVIDYKDLIKYFETGQLELKYKSLKAIERSFEMMDVAFGGKDIMVDGIEIDLQDAHRYVIRSILNIEEG